MNDFEYFNSQLRYEPETGFLFWREWKHGRYANLKNPVGCTDPNGYIRIKLDGHLYRNHRVAWLLSTGEWPLDQIDHKNRVRSDNRISNLREATTTENKRNGRVYKNNSIGILGVYQKGNKWQAQIRVDKKLKSLGTFVNIFDAQKARRDAEEIYFGDFNNKK